MRAACILSIFAMSFVTHLFASNKGGKVDEPYAAPRLEAVDQDGKAVKLEDFYGAGFTLVYFYPKANTPGCTAQACSLRDAYEELGKAGIKVIGVSTDNADSQKNFATKHKLPFTLLADPEGKIVKAFGVNKIPLIGYATRQAFLIKGGQVVWHDSHASTSEQAADVLKVVKEL